MDKMISILRTFMIGTSDLNQEVYQTDLIELKFGVFYTTISMSIT